MSTEWNEGPLPPEPRDDKNGFWLVVISGWDLPMVVERFDGKLNAFPCAGEVTFMEQDVVLWAEVPPGWQDALRPTITPEQALTMDRPFKDDSDL